MKEIPWIKWSGTGAPPSFNERDKVEVEYRDLRRRSDYEPWMFAGWIHYGGRTDIIAYRVVN